LDDFVEKYEILTYCPHDEPMNLDQYQNHLDNVRHSQERAARGGRMDGTEYRAAIKAMRLSQVRAARWLGISGRTSQAYALGERPTRLVRLPMGIPPARVAGAAAVAQCEKQRRLQPLGRTGLRGLCYRRTRFGNGSHGQQFFSQNGSGCSVGCASAG
jgi:hypothetical protein